MNRITIALRRLSLCFWLATYDEHRPMRVLRQLEEAEARQ